MLTDAVGDTGVHAAKISPQELQQLETRLCALGVQLAERSLREACLDIEDVITQRVLSRLRSELPELVNRALHEHFEGRK